MIARLFAIAAAIAALLFGLATVAQEQLTLDSPCGAPGVGRRNPDKVIEARSGVPGIHVDADGTWTTCEMPKPPEPPRACTSNGWKWQSFDGEVTCQSLAQVSIPPGQIRAYLTPAGPTSGVIVLSCPLGGGEIGVRVSACNRAVYCEASSYRGTDDGGTTWWRFAGILRDGGEARATEEGGERTRSIVCSGGRLGLR